MVGVIPRRTAPGFAEVDADDHLGPVASQRPGQVPPQVEVGDDETVGVVQVLEPVHTDRPARRLLLPRPGGDRRLRRHRVDPSLTPGHEQVGDLLALPGPAGDRRCRAVLHVVRMGHDGQPPTPVFRYRFQHLVHDQQGSNRDTV